MGQSAKMPPNTRPALILLAALAIAGGVSSQDVVKEFSDEFAWNDPEIPQFNNLAVDKVTGRARYGADYAPPGLSWGKVLRSPHPHAKIVSIDTGKAEALPGVHAVITGADFPELPFAFVGPERLQRNPWFDLRNVMAKEKVYYQGQPVVAVAAKDKATAKAALGLIEVEYE